MASGCTDKTTHSIEMAVVDHKSLGVGNAEDVSIRTTGDQLSTVVIDTLRDSVGKTAGGIVVSVQNVDNRVTRLLTRDAGPDQCSDVGVIDPCLDNVRADGVHNDDGVVVIVGNGSDKVVRVAPKRQVLAIGQ